MQVDRGRLTHSLAERLRLDDKTCQHRHRQQRVGGEAGCAREDPERRVLHAMPPAITVRPSSVTRMHGMPSRRGLLLARQEERLREDLGLDRGRGDDRHAEEVGPGRPAGRRIDDVMALLAVAAPAAPVPAGGRERCVLERERDGSVARLDADAPPERVRATDRRNVSARVHERRTGLGEDCRRAIDGVALADAAEIEVDARPERDRPVLAVYGHGASAGTACRS